MNPKFMTKICYYSGVRLMIKFFHILFFKSEVKFNKVRTKQCTLESFVLIAAAAGLIPREILAILLYGKPPFVVLFLISSSLSACNAKILSPVT